MGRFLAIQEIKPTVFFIKQNGLLKQGMDILVENKKGSTRANIEIEFGLGKENVEIERVEKGRKWYRVYIPEIQEKIDAEFALFASGKSQDKKTAKLTPQRHWSVYIIHSSHHDLGYTDLPSNVFLEHDSYLDDVLKFCEETENWPEGSQFKYSVEQFWSLNHFIKNRPQEVVDKLIKFIKKGQIEITALFGNEITELCGHEELIRLLYPAFELKRKYNVPLTCAELNDIPGLSWGLPKVLKNAGIDYFSAGLPDYFAWYNMKVHSYWDESKVLPRDLFGAFWWEGQDGSRVLFWSGAPFDPISFKEKNISSLLKRLEIKGYQFNIVRAVFWGGDRDNSPPSLQLSYSVREWNNKYAYPKFIVATNDIFFKHLNKECGKVRLPVFRGELTDTDMTIGAVSSARETSLNRITHDQLLSAEKFSTIASYLNDYPYSFQKIKDAYENMFLYDLHCWGPIELVGPAQDASWSDKINFAYKANALTHDLLVKSINKIADRIKLNDDSWYMLVFNPLSWKRNDIVSVPLKDFPPCSSPNYKKCENDLTFSSGKVVGRNILNIPFKLIKEPFRIIDVEKEKEIPYQIVELRNPLSPVPYASQRFSQGQANPSWLYEICFLGEDIPSMGYKTYKIENVEESTSFEGSGSVSGEILENHFFKIRLNPETGSIKSIYDKEFDRELVDEEAPHEFNQFLGRWAKNGKENHLEKIEIQKGEVGPVYESVIIRGSSVGCPEIIQKIFLYQGIKRIDFANRILRDSLPFLEIYFSFPFKFENPSFLFEASNSVIEPLKDQFPGSNSDYYAVQHWVNVSDSKFGTVFSSIEAPNVELGGLWPGCVSQAHQCITTPDFGHKFLKKGELKKGWVYSYVMANNFKTNFYPTQVSDCLFRYSLTTHDKYRREAQVHKFGWQVSNPLIPVSIGGKQEGTLPMSMSFCKIDQPNASVLTLKKAEDENGLILRLMEIKGEKGDVKVMFSYLKVAAAYLTNIVEEDIKPLKIQGNTIIVPLPSFGISTVRIILDKNVI